MNKFDKWWIYILEALVGVLITEKLRGGRSGLMFYWSIYHSLVTSLKALMSLRARAQSRGMFSNLALFHSRLSGHLSMSTLGGQVFLCAEPCFARLYKATLSSCPLPSVISKPCRPWRRLRIENIMSSWKGIWLLIGVRGRISGIVPLGNPGSD